MNLKDPENKKLAGLVLLGAAIGAVLGILFAPDKGSATRKKIKDGLNNFGGGTKKSEDDSSDPESDRPV